MTTEQLVLQFLGAVMLTLALRRKQEVFIALSISFWLQYQLRDLLNTFDINPNSVFGLERESQSYSQTIFLVIELNLFLICWMFFSKAETKTKTAIQPFGIPSPTEDRFTGYLSLILLIGAFFYFGGLTDRSLMILQRGSSVIYITSLIALCYLCSGLDKKAIFFGVLLAILSTQKLLLLTFLIVYICRKDTLKTIGLTLFCAISLGVVAVFREPELSSSFDKFLSGTFFGHYESILPLYKLVDSNSINSHYPFFDVLINPFVDLYEKSTKFFDVFNLDYIGRPGVLIAPSILGFFFYYTTWLSPILAFSYIFLAVCISRKIFILLLGSERYIFLEVAFVLLLLESSPDGLTFFLRIIFVLFWIRVFSYFIFYRARSRFERNMSIGCGQKAGACKYV